VTAMRIAALGALWLGLGAIWYFSDTVPYLASLPSLVAFAFMAYFFGRTLRPGSEPFISRIARKADPDLPPEVARYTRALTGLWAICFATLFFVAVGLMLFLPLESSRWVQGLGIVVPVALFAGEHAWRHHRFPWRPRASLPALVRNVVAVFREIASEPR
jgi:uncharacterized membrane protein